MVNGRGKIRSAWSRSAARAALQMVTVFAIGHLARSDERSLRDLATALTFHASFDKRTDADFALGDRRIYTATSYKKREDATPGIGNPDVTVAEGKGRYGSALHFGKKNTRAIYYHAEKNVAYRERNWDGTVSFWLSLDPDVDLAPGYCDPIQITDEDYNDAAFWVDFTKDDRPRQFRLGVFGDLKVWNPKGIGPEQNPDFKNRLVTVIKPPFAKGRWTHVVISHSRLNSGAPDGEVRLYLNGQLQGKATGIREPFTWDLSRAAIRLGVNYVGLFDEVAIFNRALTDKEVQMLHNLSTGVGSLRR